MSERITPSLAAERSPDDVRADRETLIDELGDCLWYCALVAHELNVDLKPVTERNLAKLRQRAEADEIKGDAR